MKLSEILGWDDKRSENQEMVGVSNAALNSVVNTALTSCDREIDREALAKVLYLYDFPKYRHGDWDYLLDKSTYIDKAQAIISTMPTWLKPTERN